MKKSVTIRVDKGADSRATGTIIAQVTLIRNITRHMRMGTTQGYQQAIRVMNSIRPIHIVESILGRELTDSEKGFFNRCPEHVTASIQADTDKLQSAVAYAFMAQDTIQSCRMAIRYNNISESLLVNLDRLADTLEGFKG